MTGFTQPPTKVPPGIGGPLSSQPLANTPSCYVPGRNLATGYLFGDAIKAQAAAGGGIVAALGDSVTQGAFVASLRANSWPAMFAADLQRRYGDGGSGLFSIARSAQVLTAVGMPAAAVTFYAGVADDLATVGAGWAPQQGGGGAGWQALLSTTVGSTIEFTRVRGSQILVATFGFGASQFILTIDGVAQPATTPGSGAHISVFNTTPGEHDVLLTNNNVSGLSVYGVAGWYPGPGIRVDNWSTYGQKATSYGNQDTGKTGAQTGGALAPTPIKAAYLLYTLGLNDLNQATAPDTYAQQVLGAINGAITSIAGGTPSLPIDVHVHMPAVGKFDNAATPNRSNYVGRLLAMCQDYGYVWTDSGAATFESWDYANSLSHWGNSAAPGTVGTDPVHRSPIGAAFDTAIVEQPLKLVGGL